MMDLSRSSRYLPALAQFGGVRKPALAPTRVYSLVASWLSDGSERGRPILSLRRHQAAQAPLHRSPHTPDRTQSPRPFVVRAMLGERIEVQVTNYLAHLPLSLALVDDDFGIMDGADAPVLAHGETHTYCWNCCHAGVYPMYNRACPDPVERRSLLGVLIVEP
jgi:hypothetical protein